MMTIMHPEFFRDLHPDSKLRMLMQLADQAEIVIVISAGDIEKNKVRGDLGITYDADVLRLRDSFSGAWIFMSEALQSPSFPDSTAAINFKKRLEKLGVKVYIHLLHSDGYPKQYSADRQ